MSGNRGAKGSIKDRLISMLYRIRYKKKKLKEEFYTVLNKQKQKDYLDHLVYFQKTNNFNVLSNKEKKNLEDVKFDAKVNLKGKKGIDIVDIKLNEMASKDSEYLENVDLKREIKKTGNEIIILKEVNEFVKKSLENIESIKEEIEEIKQESKESNKPIENLEEKYKKLKDKVKKIKLQYDTIKDKYDLSEFRIIESIKLIDSITDYKTQASLNEMEMMLNVCKKEINKIESITVVNEEKSKVGANIKSTKKEQNIVKIRFNMHKEKANEINNIEQNLRKELELQKQIIDDMYYKASYFQKKYKKEIRYQKVNKLFPSFLRITGGLLTLPLSGLNIFGDALGYTMINKGLKSINKSFERKEKIVIDYEYEDISKKILEVKDKVEYTNLILMDSLNEINKMKFNISNIFSKYDEILPEYNTFINNISELEKNLVQQQSKISKMNETITNEEEMNKQKLKKIGKY